MIDEIMIEKARKGDKAAFLKLFSSYENRVLRTAYLILRDKQYAEDAVQETFLQVYLKIGKLSNTKAFEVWLYRITVNICTNLIKKLKRINTISIDEEDFVLNIPFCSDYNVPHHAVIQEDIKKKIMESIHKLPSDYKTSLILFYYNELSIKDIAYIVNSSEGTVKSRLFRGKKMLKDILAVQGINIYSFDEEVSYEVRGIN